MYEEQDNEEGSLVPKKESRKVKKYIAVIMVVLILAGTGFVFARENPKARAILGIAPKNEQEAVSRYLAQLSHLMVLPVDDNPVLATVEDPEALIKQQAFFNGSQKGDVVLIFPKTSRAVLFSPKKNLIINAGPVIQNQKTAQEGTIPQP